jgi:hypothetical protein
MDSANLNILVEARKEYLDQMYLVMCPNMIEAFEDLYKESYKVSKGKKVLIQYQTFLKEVVNWNDHMIKQHTDTMCNTCSWFNDLLAAVFVSSVKILSSVRLNSVNSKISIKLPTNQVFIHGCFVNASKDLYKNPYIFHEDHTEQERDMELIKRFSKTIESTVKEMIPVQEILKSCISQEAQKEEIDITNELPEDNEDPDIDDEEEEEGEGEEVQETGETPVEEPENNELVEGEMPTGEQSTPPMGETKNIDIIKKPQNLPSNSAPTTTAQPASAQNENLFDDAPDM